MSEECLRLTEEELMQLNQQYQKCNVDEFVLVGNDNDSKWKEFMVLWETICANHQIDPKYHGFSRANGWIFTWGGK